MDPIGINFYLNFWQVAENVRNQYVLRLEYRHIRDVSNPFELPDVKFVKLFRLNKELAQNLINEILPFVGEARRIDQIPLHLQVFVCLNFYGHGGYQTTIGHEINLGISQPVVSRIINRISQIFTVNLLPRYVKFPSTNIEIRCKKQGFMEKLEFPHTIGAIDCTHIAIVPPKVDDGINPAALYINRKGYHSINVQLIVDADMRILNINARYPGATHDSAIWEMSTINHHLRQKYQEGRDHTWLIGDSGYPLQPWLMTPINNALPNTPEAIYTSRHCHARNVVERGIGIWKERFRCLKKDRVLHYKHGIAGRIIYACAVLHNICRMHNLPEIDENENDSDDDDD